MEIKNKKPPGKKLIKNMSLNTKWIITLILGLLLISYGAAVLTQAGIILHTGTNATKGLLLGVYSLLVLNGGLLTFGNAIIFKSKIISRKLIKKELKKRQRQQLRESKPLVPTKMTSESSTIK